MAELKTRLNDKSVNAFIKRIPHDSVRKDCKTIIGMMKRATGSEPKMWGDSIVGFGSYHYKSESGREGDWFLTGFSPRKGNLTLYIITGFGKYETLLGRLGKHSTGKSCLYIKNLDEVDTAVLRELITHSVRLARRK